MGASFDIDLYNNTLFVVAYTSEVEEALHLFNKNDGNHIKSILPKGRGPGEALTVSHIDIDRKNGNVYFYDYVANKMHHFSSDSVIHHVEFKKFMHSCRYPIYMYRVLKADSRLIAVKGLTEANGKHPRLSIINKDTIISKYYDFPLSGCRKKTVSKRTIITRNTVYALKKIKLFVPVFMEEF